MQAPENGYTLRAADAKTGGIFYEPHCMWKEEDLEGMEADVIVTPTYGQRLGPAIAHYTILNSG